MPEPANSEFPLEFSRPLEVADLEHGEVVKELTATADELVALQKRFDVETLEAVSAKLTVSPEAGGTVKVEGRVRASLSQLCVVSLEPIDELVDEEISVTYLPPGTEEPSGAEAGELGSEADFEEFDGVVIELGELTAQQIAAAMNPYPRKEGVEFGNQGQLGDNAAEERENPFAVLQKLKDQDS